MVFKEMQLTEEDKICSAEPSRAEPTWCSPAGAARVLSNDL